MDTLQAQRSLWTKTEKLKMKKTFSINVIKI